MPTESIFHNVEIKTKKQAEKLIVALEKASKKKFKPYKMPKDIKIIWKG